MRKINKCLIISAEEGGVGGGNVIAGGDVIGGCADWTLLPVTSQGGQLIGRCQEGSQVAFSTDSECSHRTALRVLFSNFSTSPEMGC